MFGLLLFSLCPPLDGNVAMSPARLLVASQSKALSRELTDNWKDSSQYLVIAVPAYYKPDKPRAAITEDGMGLTESSVMKTD